MLIFIVLTNEHKAPKCHEKVKCGGEMTLQIEFQIE